MSSGILFTIAGWIALGAALISSICWIILSISWLRIEKKRIKKTKENDFL